MSRNQKKITRSAYTVLDSGVIKVARTFTNLAEPWSKDDKVPDFLGAVDHSLCFDSKKEYEHALAKQEEELNQLVRKMKDKKKALIVVLQGRDGAGKTGAVSRIEEALGFDHKIFDSVPIGPPTEEERAHPYLWRFFKHDRMPEFGQLRVFDRSWAERVLVEKVMKLTDKEAIRDSYAELRGFEWMLQRQGCVVVKLWLDISKGEQKKRFEDRHRDKPWKVSDSDDVAREHWDEYTPAANELFLRTGTDFAPWYIISSEDKRYSRVTVLATINAALREALGE